MTTSSIANATLGDLVAFHAQVETLAQAGLLPPSNSFANAEVARTVNCRVASRLALKTAQGGSFPDAFCSAPDTAASYRLAFLAWYCTNRSPQSFDLLNGYQPRRADFLFGRYVSLQLGIISAVAFCVLVLWVWNAVPSLALFSWRKLAATQIPHQPEEKLHGSQQAALRVDFVSLLKSSGYTLEDSMATYCKAVGEDARSESLPIADANLDVAKWAVHQTNDLSVLWKNSWNAYCLFATIAGVIVFGVAVALFHPMIELLLHLCQYGGA